MFNLAVFVSGRGSNLKAILDAISCKYLNAEIKAVVTDKSDCKAIELAKQFSIPYYFISKDEKPGFISYIQLSSILAEAEINLIVLAGFLKLLPADLVEEFEGRIINIHPALLPSFGGAGMYGINVHRAVYNSSAKVSGATVHYVDRIYDNGKIIAQRVVDINDVQSPEEIAQRVLLVEHELLPYVIKKISEGKVVHKEKRIVILN